MEESITCPMCGAENSMESKYCGLCLHYFGAMYSKGLLEPPDWYSASNHTMVYSEGSFLTAQVKNVEPKEKKARGKNAFTNQRISPESENVQPTAWI